MLIDLDREEIEILISGLWWRIHETNCDDNHIEEYNLTEKLENFLEKYTEI